ncbi:MAG: vWA domain-containing protein [Kofleriaceae bacterium]
MVPTASTAHRVRTSLALGAAGATLVAALLATPGGRRCADPPAGAELGDDGMRLSAQLASSRVLGGAHEEALVVSITAPGGRAESRPPRSISIVIDRSGSMEGEPIAHARAAAARLIGELDERDAFAIVTYSSAEDTAMPMTRATPAAKSAALAAIEQIDVDGGTCISCGLLRGASELARSPVHAGVQRLVLISDGQANEGIADRDELVALAATTASRGASISALGVGLDFDERTMMRIAEQGRGNYYFVEDTRQLAAVFSRELGGLAETIAADVQLVLTDDPAMRIVEAYGYPLSRVADQVMIPIADLRAGETRKVVVKMRVSGAAGQQLASPVRLGWRRVVDGAARRASATARAHVVSDPAQVAAGVDPRAVEAIEQALAARAFEQASTAYETQGAAAAQQVLQHQLEAARDNAHLGRAAYERLERANAEAADNFAKAGRGAAPPAKAVKFSRAKSFELAR